MVDPRVGMAPQEYDPNNVGISPEQALPYYGNQGQLTPNTAQQLASQTPQIAASPNTLGAGGSQAIPANIQPQQQSPQQMYQQANAMMNPLMPMMLMGGNFDSPSELQTPDIEQAQQPSQEITQPNIVGIGANGNTFSYTVTATQNIPNTPPTPRFAAEAAPPPFMLPAAANNNDPSFPPAADVPYRNMSTAQYNPVEIPPENAGMNWGAIGGAVAIGAGAAMGAALLAQATRSTQKKKRLD